MLLLLPSCNLVYRRVSVETIQTDRGQITQETKVKLDGGTCLSKEITTERDSLHRHVTFKEVVTYDCQGAYSYEVRRKTWTRVDGKKVVTVTKKRKWNSKG